MKVKLFEMYGNYDQYGDYYKTFSSGITEWEEVNDEDYEILKSYVRHSTNLYLAVQRDTVKPCIQGHLAKYKEELAKKEARAKKAKLAEEKRKKTMTANKAKKEKALLDELKKKYEK